MATSLQWHVSTTSYLSKIKLLILYNKNGVIILRCRRTTLIRKFGVNRGVSPYGGHFILYGLAEKKTEHRHSLDLIRAPCNALIIIDVDYVQFRPKYQLHSYHNNHQQKVAHA